MTRKPLYSILWLCVAASVAKIAEGKFCYPYCDDNQICCNGYCTWASDCQGYSCIYDSDCAVKDYQYSLYCCDGTCQNSECFSLVGIIIGSVVGGLVVIATIVVGVAFFCFCRRPVRPNAGRVVLPSQQQRLVTSATNYNPPQPSPYQGAPYNDWYPPYQQPPPGNYSRYGTMNPRAGGEQPPMQYQTPICSNEGALFAPPPYIERDEPSKNSAPIQPSAPPM